MTARVLVVDDIPANVKLLEARLTAEYFDVTSASSGPQALQLCAAAPCDIILLDVMMPGMDGFEVCRRLKADTRTQHIPVVMVTALDQPADRVRGLEAGADDFLTKPVSDIALLTRVRSLVRLKQLTDELRLRAMTTLDLGLPNAEAPPAFDGADGRVLIVDDRRSSYERLAQAFRGVQQVEIETKPQEALFRAAEGDYDLMMVSLALTDFDGLRLCSQVRSIERVRSLPMLVLVEADDNARLMRALDMGVNDYLMRPVDRQEMLARVATQIRKKRYADRLRDTLQHSLELAITDGLTGLYNRRYFEGHLGTQVQEARREDRPLSVLVLDIDYFKSVNDTYGHDAGDDVLREFARRVRKAVRGVDLCCRYGGEEFVVVMPETDLGTAYAAAERIRERIAAQPFPISGRTREIPVTISVGVAGLAGRDDTPAKLIKRADEALYAAKRNGRNRVAAEAA
jgi:two-component system cell cycle response regulator